MRICVVFNDMLEIGGLEEYAVTLAVALKQQGHHLSMLSAGYVDESNPYSRRLRENEIELVQLPKWISKTASDWDTRVKLLHFIIRLLTPLIYLLGFVLFVLKKRTWENALNSSRNWLKGKLLKGILGSDRRKPLFRMILSWWRFHWRPDIIHIHGYTTNLLFVIDWAHKKRIPVVYEEHQTPDNQFNWWKGFETCINKANVVVTVSETSARALQTVCGVTRPVMVCPPIIPDPTLSGWDKADISKESTDPFSVVTVGRLYVTKGLEYLLETIPRVRKIHPSIQFRVYGEGDLRESLLKHAGRIGLDGESIFVGAFKDRQQLFEIMSETDIFLMSSILEGQPSALVEAMAFGRPIVATAVGGIPELIQDGINGLLCRPRDPECLAQKLILLIEHPEFRYRLGKEARRSYEKGSFQPSSAGRNFVSIYQKALERCQGTV